MDEPFVVPYRLREATDLGGPEREQWLYRLPGLVDGLVRRWGLRLGDPFEPGGGCSWVAPGVDPAGKQIVLKVAWLHSEGLHEAEGLALMAGRGAVAVREIDHSDDQTVSMLLERCTPGTELRARPEPEQDVVIAGLLREVWATPLPADHVFRPLSQMVDHWTDRAEEILLVHPERVDAGIAREGFASFRDLARTGPRPVLLWTDLHAANVLYDAQRGWRTIDPKPYLGDPHYDVLQHLVNCPDRLTADPYGLIARIADLTELDADRIARWLAARCVVEVAAGMSPQDLGAFWSALAGGRSLSGT